MDSFMGSIKHKIDPIIIPIQLQIYSILQNLLGIIACLLFCFDKVLKKFNFPEEK